MSTDDDINQFLSNLNVSKATGPDDVSANLLKMFAYQVKNAIILGKKVD